ncbi:hypothetical protein SAY87_006323 [Trapa incisa]|uniref:Transmembrane protein n=1 Tax=Trapa incisa TaxID=236973 RepID=A0AAN7PYJ5_9MYRT|nr:hypothetical protein SAY87_006323 [Trapa incisa]
MASVRHSRVDGRRQSNHLTAAVVIVVAFSLFVIWMFMPSPIIPTKIAGSLYGVNTGSDNNDVKQKVTIKDHVQQFEDGSGDLQENDENAVEKQLGKLVDGRNERWEEGSDDKSDLENLVEETNMNSNSEMNKGGINVKGDGKYAEKIQNNERETQR